MSGDSSFCEIEGYKETPSLIELGLTGFADLSGERDLPFQDSEGNRYVVSPILIKARPGKDKCLSQDSLSLGRWHLKEEKEIPIGHVDFSLDPNGKLACCHLSRLGIPDDDYPYPEKFRSLIRAFEKESYFTALWIHSGSDYRRKKLGALLWALGLGTLELMGYKACQIREDNTAQKWGTEKGFFGRFGAQDSEYYSFIATKPMKDKEAYALTHLTAEQEAIILRFFKKD